MREVHSDASAANPQRTAGAINRAADESGARKGSRPLDRIQVRSEAALS
jgi:hypothetical protein